MTGEQYNLMRRIAQMNALHRMFCTFLKEMEAQIQEMEIELHNLELMQKKKIEEK